jgi:3-dehydroquinate dehydratase/shikimate dehydrogenase
MISEHRRLAELGAKLVELRVDYINGDVDMKRLLADRPCPVVVTCRRKHEGGMFSGTEEARLALLRAAIAEGADYVDLEEDAAASFPRVGTSKRIVSFHDFHGTPDDLDGIHRRLCSMDPDVVKICTTATRPADNLRMLRLVRGSKTPTVGFCMGDIGAPTRLLCGKFGSPWTYATFQEGRPLAPGQFSYQQMTELYRYDAVNADTQVFGVIADPVGHSLSPLIHNTAFRKLGMNNVYVPIRVAREHLAEFLDGAPELGIRGLSVTIPHKEAVIGLLDCADEAVRGIRATNTVVFQDGRRLGYNTDYAAAMGSLEEAIGVQCRGHDTLAGNTALVLGAGGVGRAIAFGLVERGAQVVLCDGEGQRAVQLAAQFRCRAADWAARHSIAADIAVNCTPIGMHPKVDATPFDKQFMRPSMVVFDAVYNPEETLFIRDARACTCKVVTGVDMFVRQAAMQFKLFTGQDAPTDVMREAMKRALARSG